MSQVFLCYVHEKLAVLIDLVNLDASPSSVEAHTIMCITITAHSFIEFGVTSYLKY